MTDFVTKARPPSRMGLRAWELVLVSCGVVAAGLIAFNVDGPVRAVFTFAVLLLVPGWAIVRLLGFEDPAARLGLSIVAGALVVCLLSLAMIWARWWHPIVAAMALLLVSCLSLLVVRYRIPESSRPPPEPADRATPRHIRWAASGRLTLVPWIWLIVSLVLWAVAISTTNLGVLGDWGLLNVFPIVWYIALGMVFVLCLVGVTTSRLSGAQLAAAVASLVVILYASAHLIEDAPRLPWVYKHIAVTRYIDTFGSVDPSIDIYHRWPGFFSFTAFLGESIGYPDPVSYAAWAETVFPLINVALIVAIARAISRNRAWCWTTAIVFTICNWVGQNYFAPQALAFTLYLAITLMVVTYLRAKPRRLGLFVERILTRGPSGGSAVSADGQVSRSVPTARQRAIAVITVLLLQAAIVASHQLTPYLVVLALLPLFVLGYFRPTWLGFAISLLTILYLVPNLDYVQQNFGIFSSFDPVANATFSAVDQTLVSDASKWQARGASALTVLTILLAAAGFVRRLWNGHVRTTLIVMWLAVAPILTLLGQTYGGEGKFRVFLFGLPFYAMGVAWLFWPAKQRELRSVAGCSVALSVMLVLFVAIYYQPEADHRVENSDVVAGEWIDQNLRGGEKVLVTVPSNFPVLVGPHYHLADMTGGFASLWNYLAYNEIRNPSLADVRAYLDSAGQGASHVYLVFSDSQEQYADAHGLFPPGRLRSIENLLDQDPDFATAFDNGAVRVYQYR